MLSFEIRSVSLAPLVESCLSGFEAEARSRNVPLEQRGDTTAIDARCAPDHVERVLLNLLTNALRHTPSDGTVAVTVSSSNDHVEIAVEDDGEGISAEAAQRMFDRFWRGDSARNGGGAGLGLAIARGLIEAQGGTIRAEPLASGGARIAFTLPR